MHAIPIPRKLAAISTLLISALLLLLSWKNGSTDQFSYRPLPSLAKDALIVNSSSSTRDVTLPFSRYDLSVNFSSTHHLPLVVNKWSLDYETANCKGAKLYEKIKAASQDKASHSSAYEYSIENGWSRDDDEGGVDEFWDDAFKEKFGGRVPTESEALLIELLQSKPFKNAKGEQVNDDERSGGNYEVAYLPSFSAIIAINTRSPTSRLLERFHGQISEEEILKRIPPLNRFSDVIWTVWKTVSKTPNNLRYIGRDTITNEDTIAIIDHIFHAKAPTKGPVKWPGLTYGLDQDEGSALLGTPNGVGIAWLLIDRVGDLGPRSPKVTIFSPSLESGSRFRMLWDLRPIGAL